MSVIEFLESLGIEKGDKPDVCPDCGAKYPNCNWDEIRYSSPCSKAKKSEYRKAKEK